MTPGLKRLGGVLLALIALAVQAVWGIYQKELESRQLRTEAEAKLADLQKRQIELQNGIDKLNSNRGVEETLRQNFDLAKPGEEMVVIIEPPRGENVTATSTNWFQQVLHWW